LAQTRSSTEPPANLGLVEDYTKCAADADAQLVLFPEATMCRVGVPLAPSGQLRMRVPPPIPQPAIGSPVGWGCGSPTPNCAAVLS
jgi:hypothetical protein